MATDLEIFVELQKKAIEAAEAKKVAEMTTQGMLSTIVCGLMELKQIVSRNSEISVTMQSAVIEVTAKMGIIVDYLKRDRISIEQEFDAERERSDKLSQIMANKEHGVHVTTVGNVESEQANIGDKVRGTQQ